jgi:nicotinamide-nucleotide amidase
MRAEIIAIGNEILKGHITDTNSRWLARTLLGVGIEVECITVVGDTSGQIEEALAAAASRAALVLVTGGLGPTSDDVTKETLAAYFNDTLVLDEGVYDDVREFLQRRGKSEVSELNRAQALVPSRCTVLRNRCGTAPGMWFEDRGTVVVSMPGVPEEMREMVQSLVVPKLKETFALPAVIERTALTHGVPEAELAQRLEAFEAGLDGRVQIAYLPSPGAIRVRLTARGMDRGAVAALVDGEVKRLEAVIGDDIFGYDDDTLEQVVGRLLVEQSATVSTAESCTGGSIARLLTAVPGSSRYYVGSVISYANEIKQAHLGVDPATLARHGAVSREVVEQMARGVLERMGTDFAVATSGIAGPDGGTEDKPVGTTWIAAASRYQIVSRRFRFGELRGPNIERSSYTALNLLRRLIVETGEER